TFLMRRAALAAGLAAGGIAIARGIAYAHATLISSVPAAGARLATAPTQLRLVFSEPVEGALSHVSVVRVGVAALAAQLALTSAPHDVHTLIAPLSIAENGVYRVEWHVVSADGHPVAGTFSFVVGSPESVTAHDTTPMTTSSEEEPVAATWGPSIAG